MSFLELASLVLQAGPAAIRGISSLFDESETAETIASIVESANTTFNDENTKQAVVAHKLAMQSDSCQRLYPQLKIELEKEITKRLKIRVLDVEAEQKATQLTITSSDQSEFIIIRLARPLLAIISACAGSYYLVTTPAPDMAIATMLFAFGAAYMGLRHHEKIQRRES